MQPHGLLWTLLLLLCLAPAAMADDPPAKNPDPAAMKKKKEDILLRLKINTAIAKGARWVATQQKKNGAFHLETNPTGGLWPSARHEFGETTLGLLTLAHCGYGPDRKEIKKALAYVRKRWRGQLTGDFHPQASTYSLSLLVLALHELYAKPGSKTKTEGAHRYGKGAGERVNPCGFPAWARKVVKTILDWMLEHQSEKGLFRYPGKLPGGPAPGGRGGPGPAGPGPAGPPPPGFVRRGPHFAGPEDLSNTQYVLLALWVGSRCGYDVKTDNLKRIAKRLLAWQQTDGPEIRRSEDPKPKDLKGDDSRYAKPEDGHTYRDRARGFGYTPGDEPTGSMTTAGLGCLVTVKGMLLEKNALDAALRKALDRGIWDGIAWLQHNYTVQRNHPVGHVWHYYYLYGLERALVIAAKRFLGNRDWYKDGAKLLVEAQKKNGQWDPPGMYAGMPPMRGAPNYSQSLIDSCFALLFLKRATVKPKKPILGGPVTTPSATESAK